MSGVFDAAAWDACQNIRLMLDWLLLSLKKVKTSELKSKAGRRRLRLFLCADVRRAWNLLEYEVYRKAIETAERFADDQADEHELKTLWQEVTNLTLNRERERESGPQILASYAAGVASFPKLSDSLKSWIHTARIHRTTKPPHSGPPCDILRDLYGNPFRRVQAEPSWLKWNAGALPKMAQAIYDERANDRLPLLADALEDAGCTAAAILDHCRGPGPHVRGCWVVDLLRGQA
jgi:hypothetical protein